MTIFRAQVLSRPHPQPRCCSLRKSNNNPGRGTFYLPSLPLGVSGNSTSVQRTNVDNGRSTARREAGNTLDFLDQSLAVRSDAPRSPPRGRQVETVSTLVTMNHRVGRLRDADHSSGNEKGRADGRSQCRLANSRRSRTTPLPPEDTPHVRPSKAKSRSPGESASGISP